MLLQGLVENVETYPARSFATADAAVSDTVVFVADATQFLTNSGSTLVDIGGVQYEATPTVDDEDHNDFIEVDPALSVAVTELSPVTLVAAAETKWAWVSLSDDEDEDNVKCRVPRSLKAYTSLNDGPRSGDERESVWIETDPEPHISDPPNDASKYNATTTPIVVTSENGETVVVDGDGVTAYTDDQQIVWVGNAAFDANVHGVATAADPEGLLTAGVVYALKANDRIHRFDIATGADATLGGVFPLNVSGVGCIGIAATEDWLYIIDPANDIRRYSTLTGTQDGNPWKAGTFGSVAADVSSVYAIDGSSDIHKYDAVTAVESGSPWKAGTFSRLATDDIGGVYAFDVTAGLFRKYDASGTEDTTGAWPLPFVVNTEIAATPDWAYTAGSSIDQFALVDASTGAFDVPAASILSVDAYGGYVVTISTAGVLTCYSIPGTSTVSWRLRADLGTVFAPPFANERFIYTCKKRRTSAFSIPNTTLTTVNAYNATDGSSDTGPYWSYSAGVFTILADGVYDIDGYVIWASNATGIRGTYIILNGGSVKTVKHNASASGSTRQSPTVSKIFLSAGDTVELQGEQTSGGALDISSGSYLTISRSGALAA